ALKRLQRIRSEILLVNEPIGANYERLHSGDPILGWCCCKSESADHCSFHDKVHLAQRRGGTLPFQNFEIIAVKRLTPLRVALLQRFGDPLSHWTSPGSIRVLPRQTIMFPRCANDSLGVLVHLGIVVFLLSIFLLRFDETTANRNRVQFVGADTPIQNFLTALLGIEVPLAVLLHDWNRERKIVVSNRENSAVRIPGIRGNRILLF